MPDRDLILGVLGRLEGGGVLSPERRRALAAMTEEALATSSGGAAPAAAVEETFAEEPIEPAPLPVDEGARAVPAERPGQYTRLDELGRGGQSVVRRAIDEIFGREVALKELIPRPTRAGAGPSAARAFRTRFLREARLTGELDHPGIVAVHELAVRPDGTLFCAQKLVRGDTLKARIERAATLEQRLGLLLHLIDACHAVAYAHSRGVIHRDLKPSNIMVGAFGETVVVDWGLAKRREEGEGGADDNDETPLAPEPMLTVAGRALGTPAYMSPEQARGEAAGVDERTDVYGLGVILYELLTGRLPFEGGGAAQVIEKVVEGRYPPVREVCPEAPAELAAVAERALDVDPRRRYVGPELLADELLAFRMGARVTAYEYGSWELVKKFVRKNRAISAVGAAALAVLVGASAVIGWQLHQANLHLAQSFLERARAAEASADWGRAAGYYAASRLHADSREGRWGLALARQKMPRRVLMRSGPERSFDDVGYLPDGRELVVGLDPPWVVGREVESGRELWRVQPAAPADTVSLVAKGQVRVVTGKRSEFLDGATGEKLADLAEGDLPCQREAAASRVRRRVNAAGAPEVVVEAPGGEPRVLPARMRRSFTAVNGECAVAPAGDRAAVLDTDGIVHLFDLATFEEIASRPAPDAGRLVFTAHGLAVVRSRSIEVFGGDRGDFFVAMPGRGGNGLTDSRSIGGATVSPDGHLVVVPRLTASQADVVDLRTRSLVATVSYASGSPRFAVAPDDARLLVAGGGNGSSLSVWAIGPPDQPPSLPLPPRSGFILSDDGRRILVRPVLRSDGSSSLELYDSAGRLERTVELGVVPNDNSYLSPDGSRVAVFVPDTLSVRDASSGELVAEFPCTGCMRLAISNGGRQVVTGNGKEIALWDLERHAAVWRDGEHAGTLRDSLALSHDGRRVAWSRGATVYLHFQDENADHQLRLDDSVDSVSFRSDGARLAVVSHRSISVYDVRSLRPILRVPNTAAVYQEIRFSVDGSALVVWRDSLGTELLDSETGERFATLAASKPAAFGANENVSLNFAYRLARGDGTWEIHALPDPDDSPPEASLARVLGEAGLELRGVELVHAEDAK